MTLMVALVGEQPLPNFLPICHYQPSEVLLVHTRATSGLSGHLKATLAKQARITEIETDPYDLAVITRHINGALGQLAVQPYIFNLTGGTKPMSLAAYQIARSMAASVIYFQSSPGPAHITTYHWQNGELQKVEEEMFPDYLSLQNVFDLHYGPDNWYESGPANDEGGIFEEALAKVLREHGYEVMIRVKVLNTTDIDLAVRWGNQYGIIEAKAGKDGRKLKGIQQLNTVIRRLGTFSRSFHAGTVEPEPQQKPLTDILNVQMLVFPNYDKAKGTLAPEDEQTLLDRLGKALKV